KDDLAGWTGFIASMQSIFPEIQIEIDFDAITDENIEVFFRFGSGPRLPIDAAGTSILQASQLLAYISLFRPQVLILDEPDSHLHPDNQRVLCGPRICTGCRAWFPGHHQYAFEARSGFDEIARQSHLA